MLSSLHIFCFRSSCVPWVDIKEYALCYCIQVITEKYCVISTRKRTEKINKRIQCQGVVTQNKDLSEE